MITRSPVSLLVVLTAAATAAAQPNLKAVPVRPGDDNTGVRGPSPGPGNADGPGYDLNWYTVDGGGATFLNGAGYQIGATAGQPDAGIMTGGPYILKGGFWFGLEPPTCYANCDASTGTPLLTANDFACFLNAYVNNSAYANCDGSTGSPALTPNDFQCFVNLYAAGCS